MIDKEKCFLRKQKSKPEHRAFLPFLNSCSVVFINRNIKKQKSQNMNQTPVTATKILHMSSLQIYKQVFHTPPNLLHFYSKEHVLQLIMPIHRARTK